MSIAAEAQRLFDSYVAAYRAGGAVGCAAVFVRDGWLVSPYTLPAQGLPAIEAVHRVWTALDGSDRKEITVMSAGSNGDVGWCLATYCDGPGIDEGSSLNVLERQPDGRWLIRACSVTPNDAPLGGDGPPS
jgi:ketosteroid isomerase-like protein